MSDDELRSWLLEVQRRSQRRDQLLALSTMRGIGRPVMIVRRLQWKVRDVGVRRTAQLAVARLASRLPGRR